MSIYDQTRRALKIDKQTGKSENQILDVVLDMLKENEMIFYFGSTPEESNSMLDACGLRKKFTEMPELDNFFLPRDPCAIEDSEHCVVIEDDYVNQRGVDKERTVLNIDRFLIDQNSPEHLRRRYTGPALFVSLFKWNRLGAVSSCLDGHIINLIGYMTIPLDDRGAVLVGELKNNLGSHAHEYVSEYCAKRAALSVVEVMAINSPANIVVEQRDPMTRLRDGRTVPKRAGPPPRGSSPRTRVRYIVLPKRRAHMLVTGVRTEAESVARCPHLRRRHLRYLGSERFTRRHGETILVREAWIGPRERREENGTVYRVVLDMGYSDLNKSASAQ